MNEVYDMKMKAKSIYEVAMHQDGNGAWKLNLFHPYSDVIFIFNSAISQICDEVI